jgi:AcrR family transcriptional regulator
MIRTTSFLWLERFSFPRPVAAPTTGRSRAPSAMLSILLRATAEVLGEGPLTVARIVQRAGVGRSTFYEFFDSPEHLLEQLEQRLLRSLESALEAGLAEARTPLERLRSIARSWLSALEERALEARVALTRRPGRELLSPAGELLHQILTRSIQAARQELGGSKTSDDISVLAAAAAAEAISRRHLTLTPIREAPRVLADVMIKLLR